MQDFWQARQCASKGQHCTLTRSETGRVSFLVQSFLPLEKGTVPGKVHQSTMLECCLCHDCRCLHSEATLMRGCTVPIKNGLMCWMEEHVLLTAWEALCRYHKARVCMRKEEILGMCSTACYCTSLLCCPEFLSCALQLLSKAQWLLSTLPPPQ